MQTLFVQISSYRDRECQWTIKDLFEKAAHPERIAVGICWQFVPGEDDDCFAIPYPHPDQVRVVNFHACDARGLGWARGESQRLWRGEDFVLQIDSHMRFVQDWDEKMIALQRQCGKRAVLTLYPPQYTPPDLLGEWTGAQVQTVKSFNQDGVVGFTAAQVPPGHDQTPQPTAALAGGFVFGPGSIIEDVPADPDLYFYGEEPSLAARLWTHGYDLYSPNIPLVYHYYIRRDGSRPWDDDPTWHTKHMGTLRRLKAMFTPALCNRLDAQIDLGVLGLGTARTLEEYERFSGLNFVGRTVASYARKFPFVYGPEAETERRDVAPNPQAQLFFLGDAGIIFTADGGNLISLNTAATYIWCALQEGWAQPRIEQGLAHLCKVDQAVARQQYHALLGHLDGLGLLSQPAPAQLIDTGAAAAPATESEREHHKVERDWHSQRFYRLFDSVFHIRYATPDTERWGHAPIAHLEIEPARESNWDFRLVDSAEGFTFYVNDYWTAADSAMAGLAPHLKFIFMRCAISGYGHSLHLHAGAISNGEHCLLLPGEKGSGKTTLTAAMIRRGYRYLSDEVALLEKGDCNVRPFPVSMCVKQHALATLSPLYPELATLPVYAREDGESVRYLAPPLAATAEDKALPVTCLVFPRYRPGAQTALHPIEPVDALKRLLHDSQSMPESLALDDARDLVAWFGRVRCFEMPHSDLAAATECLAGLLPLPGHADTGAVLPDQKAPATDSFAAIDQIIATT